MAVTATPIFPQTPNVGLMNVVLSTAMTNTKAFDGTDTAGTALAQCYLAGANGSRVDYVKVKLGSTNGLTASGTSSASIIRLWINNGSDNTVAANNQYIGEVAIPGTAVTSLATAVTSDYFFPIPSINIPAGYKLYAGATVAAGGTNIGFRVSASGGDY